MTVDDYTDALRTRDVAQACHQAIGEMSDGAILLSCSGPAPIWLGDQPGETPATWPTGDMVFNAPSSFLFAPAVTVPMLAVDGMPVGVQLMGVPGSDARTAALARWLYEQVDPVVA
jgi:Asp-tRNA(Asn)/Glu-tRNA(Gln) amidotransferase A subunit family amidase